MSEANHRAVFLSYASQDAEAVKRICEALRGAGVEVWFDQNELRGGDAWDAKIRRQIRECTLFVPVISATTQARPEGYFRLEWKLAVDRSHLMADDQPFIVPVVIDDTPEAVARVPDKFREVQWTRLVLTETPAVFAARMRDLLGADSVTTGAEGGRRGTAEGERKRAEVSGWWTKVVPLVGILMGLTYAVRPWWSPKPVRGEKSASPAAASVAPRESEAQRLVAKARALYEPWDFASPDDFKLAERLLKEAIELEPVNADAYAALAIVSYGNYVFGFDRSAAREALLRSTAERAGKLAPESDFAQLALALLYRRSPGTDDEALRILQALAARRGTDKFILRQLGSVLVVKQQIEEALACYDRAAALPGGDAIALIARALLLERQQRFDEMEAVVERALALRPDYGYAHVVKLVIACYDRGDLERTRQTLRAIPARVMGDERVASVVAFMWYWARDAERATEALRYVSHDYIESNVITMPTGFLTGLVHRLAGRKEAAAIEWRAALGVIGRRLALNPTSAGDLGDKAALLALLGDRAAAEEALRAYEELRRVPAGRASAVSWQIYAELGREAEVADFFTERLNAKSAEGRSFIAAQFRFNPVLDAFRDRPRFRALAAEVDQFYAAAAKGGATPVAGRPNAAK